MIFELKNNSKWFVIDMLEYGSIKYFLLSKILNNGNDIDNVFRICMYDDFFNMFKPVEDKNLYDNVKKSFEVRLDKKREKMLNKYKFEKADYVKLKVINIDKNNYILEKSNGDIIVKNIKIYGDFKIKVNNYIYMLDSSVLEKNLFLYGPLVNDEDEIIKVLDGNKAYFLQRYYG